MYFPAICFYKVKVRQAVPCFLICVQPMFREINYFYIFNVINKINYLECTGCLNEGSVFFYCPLYNSWFLLVLLCCLYFCKKNVLMLKRLNNSFIRSYFFYVNRFRDYFERFVSFRSSQTISFIPSVIEK